jgi:hypothetical protein
MAANKEEQKPQKASKYYPAEDVAVPKKVCSLMRCPTDAPQVEDKIGHGRTSTMRLRQRTQKMQGGQLKLQCPEHC